jgi:hypothetical protein
LLSGRRMLLMRAGYFNLLVFRNRL